jgi:ribosome-associated protein
MSAISSESLARRLAALADSKKAEDIVVLDMRPLVAYTDFLVICTARNERQALAIDRNIRELGNTDKTLQTSGTEACSEAGWAIADYLDCVLHVFTSEARDRYQLEDLWREAPRLEHQLEAPEAPTAATA